MVSKSSQKVATETDGSNMPPLTACFGVFVNHIPVSFGDLRQCVGIAVDGDLGLDSISQGPSYAT